MTSNKLLLALTGLAVVVVGILVVSIILAMGVLRQTTPVAEVTAIIEPTLIESTPLPPSSTPTAVVATATNVPASPTPEAVDPTETLVPVTGVPSSTPPPAATPTSQTAGGQAGSGSSCDQVQFVQDVTIPSGMKVPAGAQFTKTWRVKNTGTCTWNVDYDLVFNQGNQLGGPGVSALPGTVKPGESVELSLTLTAPSKNGEYSGAWLLRNASGQIFGAGSQAAESLWARIKVAEFKTEYSLIDEYCDALWRNRNVVLPCPGDEQAGTGFVIRVDEPVLENGITENEAALVLQPEPVDDGLIVGHFPAFRVEAGDRFRTVIGCLEGAVGCDVKYRLSYQIGGGDVVRLAEWKEKYDGKIQKLDIDLSGLDGEKVELIISVRVEKNPQDARVFLLMPRIVR